MNLGKSILKSRPFLEICLNIIKIFESHIENLPILEL